MPSTLPRLPVRVSPGLRDLVAQAGPMGPAARALLILGARAAGLDVTPVAHEALALLGRPGLPAGVRAALLDLAAELEATSGVTGDTTGGATGGVTSDTFAPVTFAPMPPAPGAELLSELLDLSSVGLEV